MTLPPAKYYTKLSETTKRLEKVLAELRENESADVICKQVEILQAELSKKELLINKINGTILAKCKKIDHIKCMLSKGKLPISEQASLYYIM